MGNTDSEEVQITMSIAIQTLSSNSKNVTYSEKEPTKADACNSSQVLENNDDNCSVDEICQTTVYQQEKYRLRQ